VGPASLRLVSTEVDVDLDCFDGCEVGCRYFGDSTVEWRLQWHCVRFCDWLDPLR
jgi:hypothetical protein